MTLDDVQEAAQALEAEGVIASGNTVLAWMKQRGMKASKRTILKYLKLRPPGPAAPAEPVTRMHLERWMKLQREAPDPEAQQQETLRAFLAKLAAQAQARPASPPPPPPEPVPTDPVALAERAVHEAEAHFAEIQDQLLQAKGVLICSRDVIIDGVLRGALHRDDTIFQTALDDVTAAKQEYDLAWQQREDKRQDLQRVTREHRRGHQEAWVAQHQPKLVQTLEEWQEALRVATSERDHFIAKRELMVARQSYEAAVVSAPWTRNGTTPPDEED